MDIFFQVRLNIFGFLIPSMMLNFPNKLIAASNYMTLWIPKSQIPSAVWISVWLIPPIIFNMFNVRRYGEIEFWLTLQKVATFVLLIIYGLLMTMGASTVTPLSGTDPITHDLVPCNDPSTENCVGPIGFNCMSFFGKF
jgi:amino acid permease